MITVNQKSKLGDLDEAIKSLEEALGWREVKWPKLPAGNDDLLWPVFKCDCGAEKSCKPGEFPAHAHWCDTHKNNKPLEF